MQDQWDSYPCTIHEQPASIAVNLSFAERAAQPQHPALALFRVQIKAPDERGMPEGDDEVAALHALEDQLEDLVAAAGGVQVGRITSSGWRDLACYTQLDESACLRLLDEVATAHGYSMQLQHRPDPERSLYWQVLYPSPSEWQVMMNRRVIRQLSDRGDLLREPRTIDHTARFDTEADAQAFAQSLTAPYTQVTSGGASDQHAAAHIVSFQHHGVPDAPSMNAHGLDLVNLAHSHGGRYDGWGCPVVVDDGPTDTFVVDDHAEQMAWHLAQRLADADYDAIADDIAYTPAEDLERMIYGLSVDPQSVERAARWAHARPDSALAHVVLGVSMVVRGWERRGTGYGHEVAPEAWVQFLAGLDGARTPMQRAIELAPDMPEPHAWLITVDMASGGTPDARRAHFDAALARDPQHWAAHMKYFLSLTSKWGGSHDQMFDFAQRCSEAAPVGDLRHLLVAMAINEYALDVGASACGGLRTTAHAARLRQALYAWIDATPDNLADQLRWTTSSFHATAVNQFAAACYLCGADHEALLLTEALHGQIESTPWGWLGLNAWERKRPVKVHDRILRELREAAAPQPASEGAALH